MTTPLIECVPNFSDARRPEVIETVQQWYKKQEVIGRKALAR